MQDPSLACSLSLPPACPRPLQLDTLGGHHLLPALLAYSPSGQDLARGLIRETAQLYADHNRDAGETLAKAYQDSTYSKVERTVMCVVRAGNARHVGSDNLIAFLFTLVHALPQVLEFVAFKERLDAAHTRAVVRTEKQVMEIRDASLQGGLEAAAAACSAACEALPLSDAPQASGATRLRFNEDLATRPAWYPPSPGATALAPAAWWQSRTAHSGQGYGRVWWAKTSSAEASHAQAEDVRCGKWSAVRARWLLPHALAAVLRPEHPVAVPGGAPSTSVTAGAAGVMEDLARSCGVPDLTTLSQSLRLRSEALTAGESCLTAADLDLLLLAILAWFSGATSRLSVGHPAEGDDNPLGDSEAVLTEASTVSGFLSAVASALSRSAAAAGGASTVLPGSLLNLMSVVLNEHMHWLVLCVQVR